jgi:signal transduction histidine kinase
VLEERARSLQQAAEAAQMGERIKDDMLQNVNHELRTPLMGAKGYVDLVLDAPKGLSAEQVENLRISQEKLTQLTDIVESLTSLLQVENGKQRTAVDMNEMARQAVARFQKMAQQNKIAILTEFSPTPVMALANPSQIAKVLDGLLSNAIKFSPQGGQVALRVERTKERLVHVMVQDKGIGIEVQHLPHIFERFYQVDSSTTRRFGGLGVGLALVKEIVAAHGGKVWVESKIKQGSAFHFAIPAQG